MSYTSNECKPRYAPVVMYAVPREPYHPNQRLQRAREEIAEIKAFEDRFYLPIEDEHEDNDQMCRTCFHPTKHFEGCPDDDSLYAELMRNGYG